MVGESDVALEEDIIKKPKEFVRSWVEWSASNREQILKGINFSGGAGTRTIYTVPLKHTFFLTSAFISSHEHGALDASVIMTVSRGTILAIDLGNHHSDSISLAYPMPIKLEENEVVALTNDANTDFIAGVQGFLVPKQISGRS